MRNPLCGPCAITGSSGYVGSILRRALQHEYPVVALSRSPQSSEDIPWCLEAPGDVGRLLRERQVKTLVHAAWDMHSSDAKEIHRVCVQGSATLFSEARSAGIEHIVFISSISAFDKCRSVYGQSKLAVERLLRGGSSTCLRLGLVFGQQSGGVFGSIREQVTKSRLIPLIGDGRIPQFLLHEMTLAETVLRAVSGQFSELNGSPITLAHPKPWPFRDLVKAIAKQQARDVTLVPIPSQLLYAGLRSAEMLRIKAPFRSDSVTSFVHSEKNPDFSVMQKYGIDPIPFEPGI